MSWRLKVHAPRKEIQAGFNLMVGNDIDSRSHVEAAYNGFEQLMKLESNVSQDDLELTLHSLLTQGDGQNDTSDPLHSAIEKAISEMELPEVIVSPEEWSPTEDESDGKGEDTTHGIGAAASLHLTVDNILADHLLQGLGTRDSQKRSHEEILENQAKDRAHLDNIPADEQTGSKSTAYETLSPASLSPISDSETLQYKHRKQHSAGFKKPALTATSNATTLTQRIHSPVEPPAKLTNEFTMAQVADVKKRIISTHKLLLNFNFLKDGYARTTVELKKALLRLKQSEIHRAQLLQENEQLKRLVIEQNEKLKAQNIAG
ncbi:LADA_0C01156g1_1 [Lachancea dasiensis]|uniref:LADA_0C01156g1_1 n=1 Tax=Lachancea dasiensis TaxID=1072105 RepID=A0A1G4IXK4_9SACH|nr:LADA_0C01156g1_1 [Lachancea dasiensis]